MKSKKPGIGSWISFEDGLLEYKESELRKEWWYYVTKDNPYVTRNERRRNKKPAPVQVVAPPPKPTTPRVIPIKPVQKAASPDKEVRPQPPNELEPIVKEAPKKTTVKKEKKEKVTKTTPETEPLKELEPVQEPEPVPEPVQKPKIVPKPIQEPEPVKELVPELVQEQEPVKELDAKLCHINPRLVKEPIEGSAVSIYCDNKANPEALRAVLDQPGIHELPLVVIPVAGEYRGGKSFLLSYFIRYLTNQNFGDGKEELVGFKHKQSKLPVTQGIEIWSQPLIVNGSEGQKFVVLLMDSQGILGGKDDNKQASRVFALSTMLSSIMVFNLKGQINSAVLNYLEMFTSFGNVATTDDDKDFKAEIPFQKLMILIRDWQNSCNFGSEEGEQYLDEYFKENGNVFDCFFNDNCCYCMPHPGKGLTKPGATGCLDSLDEDFQQCMKDLITDICSPEHLDEHVKNVAGSPLTAGGFCDYFEICANRIMREDMSQSINVVEDQAKFNCESEKNKALKKYTSEMDIQTASIRDLMTSSAVTEDVLNEFNKDARTKSTKKFVENCKYSRLNASKIFEKYMVYLHNELNDGYFGYKESLRKYMLQQAIQKVVEAIRSMEHISNALGKIKDSMLTVQTNVRTTKWVSAVVGAGSTALCFTPAAPIAFAGMGAVTLGSICAGASGAAGAGASVIDYFMTKSALQEIEGYKQEAQTCLNKSKVALETVIEMNLIAGATGAAIGVGASAVTLNLADDAIKFTLANAGPGKYISMGNTYKVLVGVGAAIAVIDAVTTQIWENKSITNAENLQVKIKDVIKDLKKQIEMLYS